MDKKRLVPLLLIPMIPLLFAGCYRACYNCDGSVSVYYSSCLSNSSCENNNCWGKSYSPVVDETVRYKELRVLSQTDFEITNPQVEYSLENSQKGFNVSFTIRNKTNVTAIFNTINASVFVDGKYYVSADLSYEMYLDDLLGPGENRNINRRITQYVTDSANFKTLTLKVDVNAYAIIK